MLHPFLSQPVRIRLLSSPPRSDIRSIIMAGIEQVQQSAASTVPGQIDEQSFQSTRVLTEDQRPRAISLKPAFEHLP